ncbi:expressed unknown protein [Seminavis robusta]|uniref:Uncharacterized protein n=1 Tax=Seminavis robusta TaxID=568900 RepID=A0A9N8E359_9STRA|nr:expressed unknown protein [Seminavis robusta]|eukprot:Sro604_g174090.1 n/a (659) ;mRNA; f:15505-17481
MDITTYSQPPIIGKPQQLQKKVKRSALIFLYIQDIMGRATRVHQGIRTDPDGRRLPPMRSTRALLYDANHEANTIASESSTDVKCLDGFVMAPYEDELSEITDKMHNLTTGRKYPRHHPAYRPKYQHAWVVRPEDVYEQELHNHNRVGRFAQDGEAPSNPLAEDDATITDGSTLLDEDSEVPTNCSETRTTAESVSSLPDEKSLQRHWVASSESVLVASYASSSQFDGGSVSIGIVPANKTRSFFTQWIPSWDMLSRWVFLLACLLTLWLAVERLAWAENHQPSNTNRRLVRGSSDIASLRMTDQNKHMVLSQPPVVTTSISQGQDEGIVTSESIQWDSLTTEQSEQAAAFGFSQPFDPNNSRQDPQPAASPALPEPQSSELPQSAPQPTQSESLPELHLATSAEEQELVSSAPEDAAAPSSESASGGNTDEHSSYAPSGAPSRATQEEIPIQVEVPTSGPGGTHSKPPPSVQANPFPETSSPIVFDLNGIPVTKTMILAFAASLCFTVVAIVEWVQHDMLFQLALAVSGIFGLLSAMVQERHPLTSAVLHSLSVHWFLAAAALILWLRCHQQTASSSFRRPRAIHTTKEEALFLADVFFLVGSAIAVVASYVVFRDDAPALNLGLQVAGVCTAIMWVGCAVLYLCCSCPGNRRYEAS